ncbi:MAG: hypothetical protein KAH01_08480 [Caldisericia bacterium]|nr:hypothetical protein [Caldisericia bacterium]
MITKRALCFLVIFALLLGNLSCKNSVDIPEISLQMENLKNGRVALYSTYDKNTEKAVNWEQHGVIREVFGEVEYRIEHVGLANQEFQQCVFKDQPPSLELFTVYRIETPAEENKEIEKEKFEKQLVYKGQKKGKSFYSYNKTVFPDKTKRVYVGDQCFEIEILPYLLCAFPFEKQTSLTIRWVKTRVPRQVDTTESMEGVGTIIVIGEETVAAKGKDYLAYKVSIPMTNCTAWYTKDLPHILVRLECPDSIKVITEWNGI